jgi:hypothetical protein
LDRLSIALRLSQSAKAISKQQKKRFTEQLKESDSSLLI